MKKSEMNIEIGKRLRHERKLRGFTQAEAGAVIDVTFQQIQKYERGVNNITVHSLATLLTSWGIKWSVFMDGIRPDVARSSFCALSPTMQEFLEGVGNLQPAQQKALHELVKAMQPVKPKRKAA